MKNNFSNKINNASKSYTFDDVLLKPLFSSIDRESISVEAEIAKGKKFKIPFISSPMDTVTNSKMAITMGKLGGLSIIHRNMSLESQIDEVRKVLDASCEVAAAIGPQDIEWAKKLHSETGLELIAIDNAHAHTEAMIESVKVMKKIFKSVIVGNIATKEAVQGLIDAGADAIKVGIGAGSICTTRVTTGVGVPQLSAIAEVADESSKCNIPVIADGGIRTGSDVAKALAAGASSVVLGNVLAGTSDTPGEILVIKDKKYKSYRGMGSLEAMKVGSKSRYNQSYLNVDELVPEGVEGLTPYKGNTEDIVMQLASYLKSTLFYCGATTIKEFQQKSEFVLMTNAGLTESHPHDILRSKGSF